MGESGCVDTTTVSSTVGSVGGGAFAPVSFPDGTNIPFLFDSGSDFTLLSLEHFNKLKIGRPMLKRCGLSLYGVDGSPLTVLGRISLDIIFIGEKHQIEVVILKEKNISIMGLDMMARLHIMIDTASQLINTPYNSTPFVNKNAAVSNVTEQKPNLFLLTDELLPPRSHKVVSGRVEGTLPSTTYCMIDPQYCSNRYGLILPTCLTPTGRQVAFVIHNNLPHALRLKKGATIGHVSNAVVDEPEVVVDMDPDEGDDDHPPDRHPLDKVDLTHLHGEQLEKMEALLLKHQSVFSRHDQDIGKCPLKAPRLKLKEGAVPIRQAPRRYGPGQMEEMLKQTKEYLEIGMIEPAPDSPWKSWPVMAAKICPTTGRKLAYKRFCVDLRAVNDSLEDLGAYSGAVPRMVDLFDSLASALKGHGDTAVFAKLDISSAFFNIVLDEADRDIFAFNTPLGPYRFTRTPFGWKGSPNVFAMTLALVLVTALWVFVWAFLDDLLIAGRSFDDLLQRLDFVLLRLRAYGMKLKPLKAVLAKKEVPMLGWILSGSKILIDPFKKEACRLWKTPSTKKEALSFIQFCNFLRKGIPNFSRLAAPIYALTKENITFEWTADADKSFKKLKELVAEDAAIYLPNFEFTWYLTVDWCKDGGAWCLSQRLYDTSGPWRQILYGSRPNTEAEQKYPSYWGEAFNLCNACNSCRQYLEGSKSTIIMTDHASLTRLFTQPHLSAFQIRLINSIADLPNLKIIHRPGDDPRIAIVDRLSRANFDEAQKSDFREMYTAWEAKKVNAVTRSATRSSDEGVGLPADDDNFWITEQSKNECIKTAMDWLKEGFPDKSAFKSNSQLLRALFHNREALVVKKGILYRKWIITEHLDKDLIIVPPVLLPRLLFECHDLLGHRGVTKTLNTILARFWSTGLSKETEVWVRSCSTCQRRKIQPTKGELQPITKSYINEYVFMDIKVMSHAPSGPYVGYVAVVEGFSKHLTLFPIKSHDSVHLMSLFFEHYVCKHGCPKKIVSDREPSLIGQLAKDFYSLLGSKKLHGSSHRPQSDGQSEIMIKASKNVLSALMIEEHLTGGADQQWHKRLPLVALAINATPSAAHGFSPHFVMTGRELGVPSTFFTSIPDEQTTVPHSVRHLQRKMAAIFQKVQETSADKTTKAKIRWDDTTQNDGEFEVGDKVLYRMYNFYNEARALAPKYHLNAYIVLKKTGANYLIHPEGASDNKKDLVVNRDQLRPFVRTDEQALRDAASREAALTAKRRIGVLAAAELNDVIDIGN